MALVDPVDAEAEHEQQGPPRPARRRPRPTRGDRVTEDALLEVGPSTFVVIAAGDRGTARAGGTLRVTPGSNRPRRPVSRESQDAVLAVCSTLRGWTTTN